MKSRTPQISSVGKKPRGKNMGKNQGYVTAVRGGLEFGRTAQFAFDSLPWLPFTGCVTDKQEKSWKDTI